MCTLLPASPALPPRPTIVKALQAPHQHYSAGSRPPLLRQSGAPRWKVFQCGPVGGAFSSTWPISDRTWITATTVALVAVICAAFVTTSAVMTF
ncbi:hypothetical protein E2C01_101670 [Portunus trituberculatus]|uniref:Uncharacterized protein n=1 Tax=Portunus trituberculatus TaxID=210409 RepID=A0A5B7KKP3_PORTR|nr:hypothetical protein [Portunus trituberculatus]